MVVNWHMVRVYLAYWHTEDCRYSEYIVIYFTKNLFLKMSTLSRVLSLSFWDLYSKRRSLKVEIRAYFGRSVTMVTMLITLFFSVSLLLQVLSSTIIHLDSCVTCTFLLQWTNTLIWFKTHCKLHWNVFLRFGYTHVK